MDSEPAIMTIGDEIRAWCTRNQVSQKALAHLLEPDQPSMLYTVNRWVTGAQEPRHPHILRLALQQLEADETWVEVGQSVDAAETPADQQPS